MDSEGTMDRGEEIEELEALLSADPDSLVFVELANRYIRLGRYRDAVTLCEEKTAVHNQYAPGFLALGRALFAEGRFVAANEALRRAIDFDPDDPEGYRLLGELLIRRNIFTEAVALLRAAFERGVDHSRLRKLYHRAVELLEKQSTDVADVDQPDKGVGNVSVVGIIKTNSEELLARKEYDISTVAERRIKGPKTDISLVDKKQSVEKQWENIEQEWQNHLSGDYQEENEIEVAINPGKEDLDIEMTPLSHPVAEGMPPLPEHDFEADFLDEASVSTHPIPQKNLDRLLEHSDDEAETAVRLHPMMGVVDLKDEYHSYSEVVSPNNSSEIPLSEQETPEVDLLNDSKLMATAGDTKYIEPPKKSSLFRFFIGFTFLLALGVCALFGWRYLERKKEIARAIERFDSALIAGTAEQMLTVQGVFIRLSEDGASRFDKNIDDRRELIDALLWLWHRHGRAIDPKTIDLTPHSSWFKRAEKVAYAIAANKLEEADALLDPQPKSDSLKRVYAALKAQIAFNLGDELVAKRWVDSFSTSERASAAALIGALLRWGRDDFLGVEKASSAILARFDNHQFARLLRAKAVLEQHGSDSALNELKRKVKVFSPLAEAWRVAFISDDNVVKEKKGAKENFVELSKNTFGDFGLKLFFARRLISSCDLEHAQLIIDGFNEELKKKNILMRLKGEMLLAQGFYPHALDYLKKDRTTIERERKAWIYLGLAKVEKALKLIKGVRTNESEVLRVFAQGIRFLRKDKKAFDKESFKKNIIEPLKVLAQDNQHAREAIAFLYHRAEQKLENEEKPSVLGWILRHKDAPSSAVFADYRKEYICRGHHLIDSIYWRALLDLGFYQKLERHLFKTKGRYYRRSLRRRYLHLAMLLLNRDESKPKREKIDATNLEEVAVKSIYPKLSDETSKLLLGIKSYKKKDYHNALKILSSLRTSTAKIFLAKVVAKLKGESAAIEILKEGLKNDLENPLLKFELAKALMVKNQTEAVIQLTQILSYKKERVTAEVHLKAVVLLSQIDIKKNAYTSVVRRISGLKEKNATLWSLLAYAYFKSGNKENAKNAIDEAIKLAPNKAYYQLQCGDIYYPEVKGKEAYLKYIKLAPNSKEIRRILNLLKS